MSPLLSAATVRCSFAELEAFDEVTIRMRLGEMVQNRATMLFEYWRGEQLVARGEQQIACMRRQGGETVPTPISPALREALKPYGGGVPLGLQPVPAAPPMASPPTGLGDAGGRPTPGLRPGLQHAGPTGLRWRMAPRLRRLPAS